MYTDGAEELGRLDSNRFYEVVEKMDDLHQEGSYLPRTRGYLKQIRRV